MTQRQAESLHEEGLQLLQKKQFHQAIEAFSKAVQLNPNQAVFFNNLGNALRETGDLEKSKNVFHQALRIKPNYASALNNLGIIYYQQRLFTTAIPYFQKALRINPVYWEAHYNLAHSHFQLNHLDSAILAYQEVVKLEPTHWQAHLNLGMCLLSENHWEQASEHLALGLAANPELYEPRLQLANAYLSLGQLEKASSEFLTVLNNTPQCAVSLHNLGVIALKNKETKKAKNYFEQTLKFNSDNETAKHMLASLNQDQTTEKAPLSHISSLFDQYAQFYENHLKELHYNVPLKLRQAIGRHLKPALKFHNLLDIGCGTGLVAPYFADMAKEMFGVDLSYEMLKHAKAKYVYRGLCLADITQQLPGDKDFFSLIIAADVFVYIGNLAPIFEQAFEYLHVGGFFAFSLEETEHFPYLLKPSGRFATHPKYIEQLAQKTGFIILESSAFVPRTSDGEPVAGRLFVLSKGEQLTPP